MYRIRSSKGADTWGRKEVRDATRRRHEKEAIGHQSYTSIFLHSEPIYVVSLYRFIPKKSLFNAFFFTKYALRARECYKNCIRGFSSPSFRLNNICLLVVPEITMCVFDWLHAVRSIEAVEIFEEDRCRI